MVSAVIDHSGQDLPILAGFPLQNEKIAKTHQVGTAHRSSSVSISPFKIRYCYSHISKAFQINMQGSVEYLNPKGEAQSMLFMKGKSWEYV